MEVSFNIKPVARVGVCGVNSPEKSSTAGK